ncbi:MAG: hypothetical protein AABW68_01560 [archaeon]
MKRKEDERLFVAPGVLFPFSILVPVFFIFPFGVLFLGFLVGSALVIATFCFSLVIEVNNGHFVYYHVVFSLPSWKVYP